MRSVRQHGGKLNATFAEKFKRQADAANKLCREAGRDKQNQKRFLDAVKALDKALPLHDTAAPLASNGLAA